MNESGQAGGPPQILPGPFPNTKIVTDARGRSTPQVVHEDKTPEGWIEVPDPNDPVYGPKIKLPLSQALKDYPHLLERLKPGGSKPATAAEAAPEDPKKRVKDTIYKTPTGDLKWTGTGWVTP